MSLLGSLTVGIVGEMAQFKGAMKDAKNQTNDFGKTLGGFGGTVSKVFAGVAATMGGLAFGSILLGSIKDAGEAEASIAQLDNVIKSTGGAAGVTRAELTKMADALEKTTKFTAEQTQSADALLLTFTNIGKDIFPETTKIALDMAQALGTDASGGAIQLGKALNDPIQGISALSRVGVSFSDEQKKTIQALQETGDMAGAQKVILAELNKEFGGSAEAFGKTFPGQLEIAKNALGNVTETLGAALLPKLTELLAWVTPQLPAIADFFTNAFDVVGDVINVVVGVIGSLTSSLQAHWNIVQPILVAIGIGAGVFALLTGALELWRLATVAATVVQLFFNTALAANPIGIVVVAITALVAALVYLYKNNETVRIAINAAWEGIKLAATTVFEYVSTFIRFIFDGIKAFWDQWGGTITQAFKDYFEILKIVWGTVFAVIIGAVKLIFDALKFYWDTWGTTIMIIFETIFKVLKDAFSGVWNAIKIIVETAIKVISKVINLVLDVIKGDWQGAWDNIKGIFSDVWNGIVKLFDNAIETFKNIGGDIINGLINGIKAAASAVWGVVRDVAKGIADGFKNYFGIQSPSKLMAEYGENISKGLANGIESQSRAAEQAALSMASKVGQAARVDLDIPSLSSFGSRGKERTRPIQVIPNNRTEQFLIGDTVQRPIQINLITDGSTLARVTAKPFANMTKSRSRGSGLNPS